MMTLSAKMRKEYIFRVRNCDTSKSLSETLNLIHRRNQEGFALEDYDKNG